MHYVSATGILALNADRYATGPNDLQAGLFEPVDARGPAPATCDFRRILAYRCDTEFSYSRFPDRNLIITDCFRRRACLSSSVAATL